MADRHSMKPAHWEEGSSAFECILLLTQIRLLRRRMRRGSTLLRIIPYDGLLAEKVGGDRNAAYDCNCAVLQ